MKNDDSDRRVECKYGSKCYQKNPAHHSKYKHPNPKRLSEGVSCPAPEKKCRIDDTCSSSNKELLNTVHTVENSNEEILTTDQSNKFTVDVSSLSDKEKVEKLFLRVFPDDFFEFFKLCKKLNSKTPKNSLSAVNLELVGPFDVLAGDVKVYSLSQSLIYYRYYFDPPEFQTVLRSTKTKFHIGYFHDDPNALPVFVASNDPDVGCKINVIGSNIFSAVHSYIGSLVKTSDPFTKTKLQSVQKAVSKWAHDAGITLETTTESMKQRKAKVVSKTFHAAGLVVPYDKETDVGYRPLAEKDTVLKNLFDKVHESKSEEERSAQWSKLQHVITFANIATDECDFGSALELGIDMFCHGSHHLHKALQPLMISSYNLLGRSKFSQVIEAHLNKRTKNTDFSLVVP